MADDRLYFSDASADVFPAPVALSDPRAPHHLGRRQKAPCRALLNNARYRAKKSGLEFSLTEEWAEERWTARCKLSDTHFQNLISTKPRLKALSPSLLRWDPSAGYSPENSVFVAAYWHRMYPSRQKQQR
jgi:hypothetical protein